MGEVIENEECIQVFCPDDANVIQLDEVFDSPPRSAIVVLNQKIQIPRFKAIWMSYPLRVCGDGGANRLYDLLPEVERGECLPHFIVGDLDSLRDEVRKWYQERGVRILPQTTQWATDMDKCMDLIEVFYHFQDKGEAVQWDEVDHYDGLVKLHEQVTGLQPIHVVMIGAIDGRFDHTVHSISVLLKLMDSNSPLKLAYLTSTDLILLVPKGKNFLGYPTSFHGTNCGLLPLGGKIILNTTGLKWDVKEWPSSLRGSVSSSNRFVGEGGCVIETTDDFILNIEMNYYALGF